MGGHGNTLQRGARSAYVWLGAVLLPSPVLAIAPSVPMFGSYFPSWLLCLFAGVILTVIVRVLFILVGLDGILRWRVPAYMSMALGLTFLLSLTIFGR